jgi:hypothetical protein
VYLVTAQSVGGAELADFRLDLVLKRLKPCELVHSPGQALQVLNDQRAHRGVTLRGGDPGVAVDLVGNGERNILHSFTVAQILWNGKHLHGMQTEEASPWHPRPSPGPHDCAEVVRLPGLGGDVPLQAGHMRVRRDQRLDPAREHPRLELASTREPGTAGRCLHGRTPTPYGLLTRAGAKTSMGQALDVLLAGRPPQVNGGLYEEIQHLTKCQCCAARRPVISPAQPGGIWRIFLGLMAYLDLKGEGDRSMPGNQRPCRCVRAGRWGTRAIWLKLDCLNPNLQPG